MRHFYTIPEAARLLNATYMRVRYAIDRLGVTVPMVGRARVIPAGWLPMIANKLQHADEQRRKAHRPRERVRL